MSTQHCGNGWEEADPWGDGVLGYGEGDGNGWGIPSLNAVMGPVENDEYGDVNDYGAGGGDGGVDCHYAPTLEAVVLRMSLHELFDWRNT